MHQERQGSRVGGLPAIIAWFQFVIRQALPQYFARAHIFMALSNIWRNEFFPLQDFSLLKFEITRMKLRKIGLIKSKKNVGLRLEVLSPKNSSHHFGEKTLKWSENRRWIEGKIIGSIDGETERAAAGARTMAKLEKADTKHIQRTGIIYAETR